jgi:hypothetical protein
VACGYSSLKPGYGPGLKTALEERKMKSTLHALVILVLACATLPAGALAAGGQPPRPLQNDLAATAINWDHNLPFVQDVQANFAVTIENVGTEPQSVYTVKLYDTTGTELATQNGYNLPAGQDWTVFLIWTPPTPGPIGIYAKVILPWDENNSNDQTPVYDIIVQPPSSYLECVVGNGNDLLRIPVDMYYKNSLFETLFYPNELNNFTGEIVELRFFNNFISDLTDMPVRIWLGTTTLNDLSAGWIPSSQLTLVFDGTVDFPSGPNQISVILSQPFLYLNPQNLVLLVQRPMDDQYYFSSDRFRGQAVGTNRARKAQSDSNNFDPTNPPANSTLSGEFPMTGFVWIPIEAGHLQGVVRGQDNYPLAGCLIEVEGTPFSTVTNTSGIYSIYLPIGTYDVTATVDGYVPQTASGVVISYGQTTTQNFELAVVDAVDCVAIESPEILLGAYPNPFRFSTDIRYSTRGSAPVLIEIFNSRGQKVATLEESCKPAGTHSLRWDGTGKDGQAVPSGVYFCRMSCGTYKGISRIILTK